MVDFEDMLLSLFLVHIESESALIAKAMPVGK
jgi:hypothetical protein